jgi:hypothetical protein
VRSLALAHGGAAVEELARLSTEAESEAARIMACNAILDRAYGKATSGRPIKISLPDTSTVDGVSKAVAAVVQSIAGGGLTPGEAAELCSVLDVQRHAIELSDIEARLAKLEATAQGGPA